MKYAAIMDSPIGQLLIAEENGSLIRIHRLATTDKTGGGAYRETDRIWRDTPLISGTVQELQEYFAGSRRSFSLPLNPSGTPFQQAVWRQLCAIPYGSTRTYRHIAQAVGNARACRAAGSAIGKNPILIVIPCHRVIGSNGSLTGFSAGMDAKEFLLAHEGACILTQAE